MSKMSPDSSPKIFIDPPKVSASTDLGLKLIFVLGCIVFLLFGITIFHKMAKKPSAQKAEAEVMAKNASATESVERLFENRTKGVVEDLSLKPSALSEKQERKAYIPQFVPPAQISTKSDSSKEDLQKALESDISADAYTKYQNNRQNPPASSYNADRYSTNFDSDARAEKLRNTLTSAMSQSENADPNMQERKESFLSKPRESVFKLKERRQPASSTYTITAGSIIPSIMRGGVNSDLPGALLAQVSQDIFDTATGEYNLIPRGSQLLGMYDSRVAFGQERVLVAWNRIAFPDASTLDIGVMPGADELGYSGFTDRVNNHYTKIFGSALLMSMITAGVNLAQPDPQPFQQNDPRQEISRALAQQLGQTGLAITQKNLQIQPTLEVRPGYQFNIIVMKDIDFEGPYEAWAAED